MSRNDNVRLFIMAVMDAAMFDAKSGVPERHPTNTGAKLIERLNLKRFRIEPRKGDYKYARSVYTAARWLYATEQKLPA